MHFKRFILFAFTGLLAVSAAKAQDSTSHWLFDFSTGLNGAQTALVNWAAGGVNSVSGNVHLDANLVYQNKGHKWESRVKTEYGLMYDNTNLLNKTVDNLYASTRYGYEQKGTGLFYTAMAEFQTQYDRGYSAPEIRKETPGNYISTIMAPGYLNMSAGLEYKYKQLISVYFSPVSGRATFVLDSMLGSAGAFGVEKRREGYYDLWQLGMSFAANLNWNFYKNMTLKSDLNLFTPYVNGEFGHFVVEWNVRLEMAINEYFSANIGTSLKYDEKVEIDGVFSKVQFREILNIGVGYTLHTESKKVPAL